MMFLVLLEPQGCDREILHLGSPHLCPVRAEMEWEHPSYVDEIYTIPTALE